MTIVSVPDAVDFICPFCQGRCTASLALAGVMHDKPTCKQFDELEPDEFLHAVNQRNQN